MQNYAVELRGNPAVPRINSHITAQFHGSVLHIDLTRVTPQFHGSVLHTDLLTFLLTYFSKIMSFKNISPHGEIFLI